MGWYPYCPGLASNGHAYKGNAKKFSLHLKSRVSINFNPMLKSQISHNNRINFPTQLKNLLTDSFQVNIVAHS
uniref:Uncharacterized protein n=1 Tax=Rhizophora mucronata TaxID=61149 RepID=A0A2P2KC91_RHIMU